MGKERFTAVCSRCRLNLKFGNFTLIFGRLRQRIVLKCVRHVQHVNFFSFNQLDHCFLASSLLQLPISRAKKLEIIKESLQKGEVSFSDDVLAVVDVHLA